MKPGFWFRVSSTVVQPKIPASKQTTPSLKLTITKLLMFGAREGDRLDRNVFSATRTYQKEQRVVRIRSLLAFSSLIFSISIYVHCSPACRAQSVGSSRVDVRLVTDEADAVLTILAKRNANQAIA